MITTVSFGDTCTSTSDIATKSYVDSLVESKIDPAMVPTTYRYRINIEITGVEIYQHSVRAMHEWIIDNDLGKYEFHKVVISLNTRVCIFAFDRKRDAAAFKLRWV
jgi:hypothetical protein